MQRMSDIILSLLALLLLMPLFLVVAVILKCSGEGEIFYRQTRVGKNGETFGLLKFATMLKDSPNIGAGTITVKNDPRVLPFGRFLRKSKINELPQLLNVLLGDMSIIGYRPLTENNFAFYSEDVQSTITKFPPGLSGVGSIVFRGEEELVKNAADAVSMHRDLIAPFKGQLEAWYAHHRSLFCYWALIFITVVVLVRPQSMILWKVFPSLPVMADDLLSAVSQEGCK